MGVPDSTLHSSSKENIVPSSNISSDWKNASVDDDIFDDDYFKQNMPGFYRDSKKDVNNTNLHQESNVINNDYYYQNYSSQTLDNEKNTTDVKLISIDSPEKLKDVTNEFHSKNRRMNSISRKVEDYFSKNELSNVSEGLPSRPNNNNLNDDLDVLFGYTEDNTGIDPYGRAIFSFEAQYPNELSFKKGDIIHLIKHADSHWTMGSLGNDKGLFPTSYIDIIVDCLHSAEETFLSRPEYNKQTSCLGLAVAEYNFNADQCGDITMTKGDILKILKYVDKNWVIVENLNGCKGMCPKNYLSLVDDSASSVTSERESRQTILTESSSNRSRSASPFDAQNKRTYVKDDFGNIKNQEIEDVVCKNLEALNVGAPVIKDRVTNVFDDKSEFDAELSNKSLSENTNNSEKEEPVIEQIMKYKSCTLPNSNGNKVLDQSESSLPPTLPQHTPQSKSNQADDENVPLKKPSDIPIYACIEKSKHSRKDETNTNTELPVEERSTESKDESKVSDFPEDIDSISPIDCTKSGMFIN